MQQRSSLYGESTRRKAADRDVILYVRLQQGSTNQPAHYTVTVTAVVVVRYKDLQLNKNQCGISKWPDLVEQRNLESVESVAQSKRTDSP